MKATIAVLALLASCYLHLSYTIVIHEELLAEREIRLSLEQELSDSDLLTRCLSNDLLERDELLAWARNNCN